MNDFYIKRNNNKSLEPQLKKNCMIHIEQQLQIDTKKNKIFPYEFKYEV